MKLSTSGCSGLEMPQINVRLNWDDFGKLRREAQELGLSQSYIIRQLIRCHLPLKAEDVLTPNRKANAEMNDAD